MWSYVQHIETPDEHLWVLRPTLLFRGLLLLILLASISGLLLALFLPFGGVVIALVSLPFAIGAIMVWRYAHRPNFLALSRHTLDLHDRDGTKVSLPVDRIDRIVRVPLVQHPGSRPNEGGVVRITARDDPSLRIDFGIGLLAVEHERIAETMNAFLDEIRRAPKG